MNIVPTPNSGAEEAATSSSTELDGTDKAIIAGVITAVLITFMTVVILIAVYLYKHKGSYRTNENPDEDASKTLQMEAGALNEEEEEKREYFM